MDIKKLAKRVKSLRVQKIKEQKGITPEKLRNQERLKIDIGGPHDPSSPNKSHIEEGRQVSGHKRGFGGSYSNRATNPGKKSLGNLRKRSGSQNSNTQQGRRTYTAEEATEIVKEKIKNKKSEGKQTDTGSAPDLIDVTPTKVELTTNH